MCVYVCVCGGACFVLFLRSLKPLIKEPADLLGRVMGLHHYHSWYFLTTKLKLRSMFQTRGVSLSKDLGPGNRKDTSYRVSERKGGERQQRLCVSHL